MTQIALFHSVLGVRPGVLAAADLLRSHGHDVRVVDQYDGRTFDDYDKASAFAAEIGYPTLMQRAAEAVADLPDGLVCAGFSNGGGMAQFAATQHPGVVGVVLMSGAIDPVELGVTEWPPTVAAQVHYTVDDPFRNQAWVDAAVEAVQRSGAAVESYDYAGAGHLFTDPSLPAEYQPDQAAEMWPRVLAFLNKVDKVARRT